MPSVPPALVLHLSYNGGDRVRPKCVTSPGVDKKANPSRCRGGRRHDLLQGLCPWPGNLKGPTQTEVIPKAVYGLFRTDNTAVLKKVVQFIKHRAVLGAQGRGPSRDSPSSTSRHCVFRELCYHNNVPLCWQHPGALRLGIGGISTPEGQKQKQNPRKQQ